MTTVRRLAAGVAVLALAACRDATAPITSALDPKSAIVPWVVTDLAALRPGTPPAETSAVARAERTALVARQRGMTARDDSLVKAWAGPAGVPWTRETLALLNFYWPLLPDVRVVTPVRASRILALLHVAHADAVAAAADAHRVAGRRAPALAGDGVKALTTLDALDGYPSAHAAVAAASAAILSYAFSSLEDTTRFWKQAREAADARVLAGAATPIDADSGFALGRRVAALVLARARTDGSEFAWTGLIPTATFAWHPTPPKRIGSPYDPLAGSWRPFVLSRADVHRPSAPPAEGSAQLATDLAELRRLAGGERTAQQADRARYWATEAPAVHWEEFLLDEVAARRLSTTESVRAFAYANVAMYDAFLACWDAKFHYWYPRPITVETTLGTVFSTPPFPSYPSGHSTQSAAAAEVFAALFPDQAAHYHALANEASLSRVWGGVHYRFDVVAGEALGASVGLDVVARMRRDGALR